MFVKSIGIGEFHAEQLTTCARYRIEQRIPLVFDVEASEACLSIAGPGATNLLTGLWDAKVDRAPILALTGQINTQVLGQFQNITGTCDIGVFIGRVIYHCEIIIACQVQDIVGTTIPVDAFDHIL